MKRSFREPKNRYKNGAKTPHRKITTLNSSQSFENKGSFNAKKAQKKPKLADNRAQIGLSEKSKDD